MIHDLGSKVLSPLGNFELFANTYPNYDQEFAHFVTTAKHDVRWKIWDHKMLIRGGVEVVIYPLQAPSTKTKGV